MTGSRVYKNYSKSVYANILKIYHPRGKIPKFTMKPY
jgi:hypothetical protein